MERNFSDRFVDETTDDQLLLAVDKVMVDGNFELYSKDDNDHGILCKFGSIASTNATVMDKMRNTSDLFSVLLENADNGLKNADNGNKGGKDLPHPIYYCAKYDPSNSATDVIGYKFELNPIQDRYGLMKIEYGKLTSIFKNAHLFLGNYKTASDRTNSMSKLYISYAAWDVLKNNNNRFTPKYQDDDDTKKLLWVSFKVNYNVNGDDIPENQFTYESLVQWGRNTLASIKRVLGNPSENQFVRVGKLLPSLNTPSKNPTSKDKEAAEAEKTLQQLLQDPRKTKPPKPPTITRDQLFPFLQQLEKKIMEWGTVDVATHSPPTLRSFLDDLDITNIKKHFSIKPAALLRCADNDKRDDDTGSAGDDVDNNDTERRPSRGTKQPKRESRRHGAIDKHKPGTKKANAVDNRMNKDKKKREYQPRVAVVEKEQHAKSASSRIKEKKQTATVETASAKSKAISKHERGSTAGTQDKKQEQAVKKAKHEHVCEEERKRKPIAKQEEDDEDNEYLNGSDKILNIARILECDAIGCGAARSEMKTYAKKLVTIGCHSIEFIKLHCEDQDVDGWDWMKPMHKKAFKKWLMRNKENIVESSSDHGIRI